MPSRFSLLFGIVWFGYRFEIRSDVEAVIFIPIFGYYDPSKTSQPRKCREHEQGTHITPMEPILYLRKFISTLYFCYLCNHRYSLFHSNLRRLAVKTGRAEVSQWWTFLKYCKTMNVKISIRLVRFYTSYHRETADQLKTCPRPRKMFQSSSTLKDELAEI